MPRAVVPADPTAMLSVGLIEMYQAGTFPFDGIITTIPFTKINDAVAAQARGEALKVVPVHS